MSELMIAEHVARLRPYVPGKPIEEVQRELGLADIIKLASNENPLGPSPRVVEALTALAGSVAFYPEGYAPVLREAVAAHTQMAADTLVFGNGSDEILHLLCLALLSPGDEVVQGDPSFAMYEIYGAQMNARVVKVPVRGDYALDLDAMVQAVTARTRIVFLANPNNPTGTLAAHAQVTALLDRLPENVLLVLDEAYHEYVASPERPDGREWVRQGRPVALLRTFSKAYGLAGLRVGYGIMPPALADVLNRLRSPFNVNSAAQAAAAAALADTAHLARTLALNDTGRRFYADTFTEMGLDFVPSEANFVLVDVNRDSREVANALMREGVIVRPGAGLGLPRHIRVSTGTEAQNARFVDALRRVL